MFIPAITRTRPIAIILMCMSVSGVSAECTNKQFEKLYNVYFAKRSTYGDSTYRRYFDALLLGPPPAQSYRKRDRSFYQAFKGDQKALRAFFHDNDRDAVGEFGEFWAQECLVLLLRLGDECFAARLAQEPTGVRESVGHAIDGQISCGWKKHPFPKSRALYSYRWAPVHRDPLLRN
jgi:hypothetical protein